MRNTAKHGRRAAMACGAALLITALGCPASRHGLVTGALMHDGLERTYGVYAPASYTGEIPVPLVLALHGGRGTAEKMAGFSGFNNVADREGFLVCYPQGLDNQWNDGRTARSGAGEQTDTAIDDVGFISALIDRLAETYAVDRTRVYVTGASNGGMMSHRLAIELSGKLAAAAPVIACLPKMLEDAVPAAPIAVACINGTDDRFVPWDGGYVLGRESFGEVLSAEDTARWWAERNGCGLEPNQEDLPDRARFDGTRVWLRRYTGGENGTEVLLYGVEGGGHTWPGGPWYQRQALLGTVSRDLDASAAIWAFFEQHTRQ